VVALAAGGEGLKRWLGGLGFAALLGLGLACGMVWGRSPSLVAWERQHAVCLESDDWGLCGFLPDSSAIVALDREGLAPGSFPEVYWLSTFEDSVAVASLCEVLAGHTGRDGLPALIQPNYVTGSLSYDAAAADTANPWRLHDLPATPPGFERPGLWSAVAAGRRLGVWQPQLHGRWHYDPLRRQQRTDNAVVRRAAAAQILVFPESEWAWELGPWRPREVLAEEFAGSLRVYTRLFDVPPRSIIAPDYVWDDHHESLWLGRGLRIIQGQRQQRKAGWRGLEGRVRKVLHRSLTRWWKRDRVYLDRNCIFEPVQHENPQVVTTAAVAAARAAWDRGEPAMLEAHRINFVHLDREVRELGRRELGVLLAELGEAAPLYLTDGEVADLNRRGVSCAVRGGRLVLRNLTHSRRLVVVPTRARQLVGALSGRGASSSRPRVLSLGPGETRVIGSPI
jgi:hypothetical protein